MQLSGKHISTSLRAAALAAFALATSNTHAETATVTLPSSTLIEQFNGQLNDSTEPQSERTFTFNADGIDWQLTFFAPEGAEFSDATFAEYGEAPQTDGPSYFAIPGGYSGAHHIGAFSISTDYFADKEISSVSVAAALFYSSIEKKVPVSVTIGSSPTMTEEPLEPTTTRSRVKPILFTPSTPESGALTISSSLEEGGQFAFLELTVNYEDTPATVAPVHSNAVGIGHVVELTCPDPKANIFFSHNSSTWQPYDPENGIVLASEGTHQIRYYALSQGCSQSPVAEAVFTVENHSGLDHARSLAREISVKGYVVRQADGCTLIGKHATADDTDCLALDNSGYPELRAASAGTSVSASGRATDRFGIPALGSLSSLILDGKQAEASRRITPAATPTDSPVRAYDLNGRPATPRTRLLITPSGARLNP